MEYVGASFMNAVAVVPKVLYFWLIICIFVNHIYIYILISTLSIQKIKEIETFLIVILVKCQIQNFYTRDSYTSLYNFCAFSSLKE